MDTSQQMTHWKVELHSHTRYSKDSLTSLEAFLKTCQVRGIDRVAVTDHNTINGALAMAKLAPERVIVGEEIMTSQGELLAFFVQENVPPFLSPQETIRRLRDQGAFISVSHPFDRLRKGAWELPELEAIVAEVDAIEVFNARCLFPQDNAKAVEFAVKHHKAFTVGSDAHVPSELGAATLILPPFEGGGDFGRALTEAQVQTRYNPFWVHFYSKYAKWMRKLGVANLPGETIYS